MGHNETQKKEETNIAYMLSEYLSIIMICRLFSLFQYFVFYIIF